MCLLRSREGLTGQAGALKHGISRALTQLDSDLRSKLKKEGFLTRDPREKRERSTARRAHEEISSSPRDNGFPDQSPSRLSAVSITQRLSSSV